MVVGRHTIICSIQEIMWLPITATVLSPTVEMQRANPLVTDASLTIRHLSTCMTVRSLCPNGDLPFLHWLKPLPVENAAVGRLDKDQLDLGTGLGYGSLQGEGEIVSALRITLR